MAKRRKIVRRATSASVVRSRLELLELKRLKKATDRAYENFWLNALGINKPPNPPRSEELLCQVGQVVDYLMKILPPPRPPFY